MTSLRQRQKTTRRAKMIDTAIGLVAEHGFDGMTIEQVADAIEMSPRTVYRYFATKEDLVLAPVSEAYAQVAQGVRDADPGLALFDVLQQAWSDAVGGLFDQLAVSDFRTILDQVQGTASVASRALLGVRMLEVELAGIVAERPAYRDRSSAEITMAIVIFNTAVRVAQDEWVRAGESSAKLVRRIHDAVAALPDVLTHALSGPPHDKEKQ